MKVTSKEKWKDKLKKIKADNIRFGKNSNKRTNKKLKSEDKKSEREMEQFNKNGKKSKLKKTRNVREISIKKRGANGEEETEIISFEEWLKMQDELDAKEKMATQRGKAVINKVAVDDEVLTREEVLAQEIYFKNEKLLSEKQIRPKLKIQSQEFRMGSKKDEEQMTNSYCMTKERQL